MPVTIPSAEPTTTAGLLLLHEPPPKSLNVIDEPAQTAAGPVMASGADVTVIVAVAMQPAPGVYVIIAVPEAIPVTTPEIEPMLTAVLPVLHLPPGDGSLKLA